jgi:Zn-dependent protease
VHDEKSLRFVPLARIGATRFGVAPSWLPAQAIGLLGFGVLAYCTVAGHLGESLGLIGSARVALVLMAALDVTVLVHELGHAAAASMAGIAVRAVVLMPYGGATIRSTCPSVNKARWTAAGGPLANLLAAMLCGLLVLTFEPHTFVGCVLLIGGAFQALSAVTNLVPIARLDGARIFAARG